jgi:hypothetical protein
MQLVPLQQPVHPLVASHTHSCDALHRCPVAHAAAEPQVHSPPTQLSARRLSQAAQASPPLPQCCFDTAASATQVSPSQQPSQPLVVSHTQVLEVPQRRPVPHSAGVVGLPHEQTPAMQASALSASHAAQAAPPVPHFAAVRSSPVRQVSPSQQPSAQVSALQPTAVSAAASVCTGAASCCGNSVQGPVWSPLWQ